MAILAKQPEIEDFLKDQKIMTPVVKKYLGQIPKDQLARVEKFDETFSAIDQLTNASIEDIRDLPDWTYTADQKEQIINDLTYLIHNYPVPRQFANKVAKGLILRVDEIEEVAEMRAAVSEFVDRILAQQSPEPLQIDLSKIGQLGLRTVHDESTQFFDPLLSGRVGKIWTLNVLDNPGLSIKDVMAKQMIEDALESGELTKDMLVVEGTSGNTGAGMAIVCASLGLKIVLIIPNKMSEEKINRLANLGAHVIVSKTKVDADDERSYYSVRDYIKDYAKGWKASQYDNLSNRKAHEQITGPLIDRLTNGQVTTLIATAGTCGTVSGISRYLKSKGKLKTIAIDTIGSILYLLKKGYKIEEVQQYARGYTIQGFGEDIYPKNLDLATIDHFIRVGDVTGITLTRVLPILGLLGGQSTGAAYAGVLEALDQGLIGPQDNVMMIMPDIAMPYRKDAYNKDWLKGKEVFYDLERVDPS